MKDLFKIKPFRRLYLAALTSSIARNITAVGLSIFTYEMTHSALSVILIILFRRTPAFFWGMVAGYIADHYHKRWVMGLSEILSAIALSLILGVHDAQTLWIIYVSFCLLALATTTAQPCRSASISEIVPPQLISSANTFLSSAQNMTMIFGSALGGVLYSIWGIKYVVLCSVALLLSSGVLILSIKAIQRTENLKHLESAKEKILGGWFRIKENVSLRLVFTYNMMTVISFTAYNLILTLYPLKLYHFQSSGVGWFNSIYGLSTLVATLIVAKVSMLSTSFLEKKRPIFLVLNGMLFILMSLTTSKILGMGLFFFSVVLYMLFFLSQENLLLQYAGKAHVGRVSAFDNAMTIFMFTFAGLGYGKLGDVYPVFLIGIVAGIFLILVTLGYEAFIRVRKPSYAVVQTVSIFLIFILFSGCTKISGPPQKSIRQTSIDRLTLNLYAPFIHLDPPLIFDMTSNYIAQQVNRGLVQVDMEGQIKPAIAEKWEISPDQKKYIFYLRKGALFHNGREITADDFVYSFSRVVSPNLNSPVSYYLEKILGAKEYKNSKEHQSGQTSNVSGQTSNVKGLRSIDRYTLEITLAYPYVPFIRILATPATSVLPREDVENKKNDFDQHPVGAGPYMFDHYDLAEKKIYLRAYEGYFEGAPSIKWIECEVLTQDEAYYRFLAKDLDYFKIGDYRLAEKLIQKGYPVKRSLQNGLAFIGINHGHVPLSDENIRHAMQLALDSKAYQAKVLSFSLEAADQFLPRDLFGRIDTSVYQRYSVDRAKDLISKSRYASQLKKRKLNLIKFDLYKNNEEDIFLKDAWSKVGIDVEIVYLERKDYRYKFHNKDFDLIYIRCSPDIPDPDNLIAFFHSKGSYNFFNYHNRTVDELIDQGPTVPDFNVRNKIYQKISQIIYEDVVAIPLYYYDDLQAFQPHLKFGEYRYVANEDIYIISRAAKN